MQKLLVPRHITINASSICQLGCPECPTVKVKGTGRSRDERYYLKLGDFEKLLEDNPRIRSVEFANHGELFLNPDLLGILETGFRKGVALTVDGGVNLNDVEDRVLEGVVKYRLRTLAVALDGASNETYRIYRAKGDFGRVLDNIARINSYKEAQGSRYPHLRWQFLVFGHNEQDLPAARRMARELGMEFAPMLSYHYENGRPVDSSFSPIRDRELARRELGFSSLVEFKQVYGVDYLWYACQGLWENPQLNWDGAMMGCCIVGAGLLDGKSFSGNVFTDGLAACANSERMRRARAMLQGREPPAEDVPCSSCWLYMDRRAASDWVKRTAFSRPFWNIAYTYQRRLPRHYNAVKSLYRSIRHLKVRLAGK